MQRTSLKLQFGLLFFCSTLCINLGLATSTLAVESRFDTDAEGWIITDDGASSGDPPEYRSTGGNSGGYIRYEEPFISFDDWFFRAPAKFRGNFSGGYASHLTYDLRQDDTGEGYEWNEIYLRGGGLTLTFETLPPGQSWTGYSIPLVETAGWQLGNRAPSRDEMLSVLVDLTDLQIRGEFQIGPDSGGLDNVVLPSSAVVGLAGDYDRNSVVDADDYELWKATFGSTDILLADGNGNGAVDLADYPVWRNNLGAATPEIVTSNVAPEPSSVLIGLGAVVAWSLVRSAGGALSSGSLQMRKNRG